MLLDEHYDALMSNLKMAQEDIKLTRLMSSAFVCCHWQLPAVASGCLCRCDFTGVTLPAVSLPDDALAEYVWVEGR